MTHDGTFPFLTVLILLPAIAAVAVALVPRALGEARRRLVVQVVGLAAMTATLALAVTITVVYRAGNGSYRLVSDHQWAPSLGIGWHLGVDGISVFLLLMSALLFPLALLASRSPRDPQSFVTWLLVLEAACLGGFVSLDLILFFLFFEMTLVPMYFIVAGWGFARRAYAAMKFFLYTFLGSAFLLVGIVAVSIIHERQTGVFTFDLVPLTHTHLGLGSQVLLFVAFTSAFAVKAPIFPFHTWSPDAYAEAPMGGSVLLAAVMAKLGTYGIIRFDLSLFPRAVVDLAPVLLTLGVIGILYGAIVACATRDLKRLVAYSSLAHLGFIVLGTFALTTEALTGSVIQMINHGLVIALLFIVIGWIYERRKTWQTSELRGLQRPAPVLAAVFMVALLATIGLPGLNGFVGEFLILLGTFVTHRWWAVVATGGVVLAALYMLWVYQQAFHHEPDAANASTPDIGWREGAIVAPLVVLIIFLGVYPKPVLDRITPSVDLLVRHLDQATQKQQPAVVRGGPAPASAASVSATSPAARSAGQRASSASGTAVAGVAKVVSSVPTGVAGGEVQSFLRRLT